MPIIDKKKIEDKRTSCAHTAWIDVHVWGAGAAFFMAYFNFASAQFMMWINLHANRQKKTDRFLLHYKFLGRKKYQFAHENCDFPLLFHFYIYIIYIFHLLWFHIHFCKLNLFLYLTDSTRLDQIKAKCERKNPKL